MTKTNWASTNNNAILETLDSLEVLKFDQYKGKKESTYHDNMYTTRINKN